MGGVIKTLKYLLYFDNAFLNGDSSGSFELRGDTVDEVLQVVEVLPGEHQKTDFEVGDVVVDRNPQFVVNFTKS